MRHPTPATTGRPVSRRRVARRRHPPAHSSPWFRWRFLAGLVGRWLTILGSCGRRSSASRSVEEHAHQGLVEADQFLHGANSCTVLAPSTATRSAAPHTRSRSWVIITIVRRKRSRSSSTSACTAPALSGSRPAVGSSKNSNSGSSASAGAIPVWHRPRYF